MCGGRNFATDGALPIPLTVRRPSMPLKRGWFIKVSHNLD